MACVVLLFAAGCTSAKMQEARERWQAQQDRFEQANAKWNAVYEQRFHERFNRYVRPSQYRLDPVMADPAADEATTVRDWEASAYHYPNGATPAYPTYTLNYEDRPAWLGNDYCYAAGQPAVVMGDVALMPLWLFVEPPWIDITYHGAQYGPSMTVAPPLPAE